MPDPTSGLDPVVHPLPRLSICAVLAAGPRWVDFRTVREATDLADSMVSKHTRALEDAGYVEVRKGVVGRRPRTWFRLTPLGRRRYRAHVSGLQQLVSTTPTDQENTPTASD
jgi:DNA-binding MarR family transcriptional regulator